MLTFTTCSWTRRILVKINENKSAIDFLRYKVQMNVGEKRLNDFFFVEPKRWENLPDTLFQKQLSLRFTSNAVTIAFRGVWKTFYFWDANFLAG